MRIRTVKKKKNAKSKMLRRGNKKLFPSILKQQIYFPINNNGANSHRSFVFHKNHMTRD